MPLFSGNILGLILRSQELFPITDGCKAPFVLSGCSEHALKLYTYGRMMEIFIESHDIKLRLIPWT
jgi:hypothetical protein